MTAQEDAAVAPPAATGSRAPEARNHAVEPPPPAGPSGPPGPGVTEAVGQVFKIVGAVAAPTTLLTGLLLYFGRQHATALFDHFGIPSTVFELTPQDYLVRSADGLFVPLAVTAGLLLAVLWGRTWFVRAVPAETRRVVARWLAPLSGVVGLALVAVAVAGVRQSPAFAQIPDVPGLCLALGTLALAAALQLLRSSSAGGGDDGNGGRQARAVGVVAEWGAVFVLVAVGLFWSVGNYASGVGRSRAVQIERELGTRAEVAVFSEKRLGLGVAGVSEYVCTDDAAKDDSAYRFRYDGLKLVFQAGGLYLFLPPGWTPDTGPAIVIPRTDSLRLEFSAPGRAQVGMC